jgi:hypothetical protein
MMKIEAGYKSGFYVTFDFAEDETGVVFLP